MSKNASNPSKHRGSSDLPKPNARKRALTTMLILSAVAVAGTATAVTSSSLSSQDKALRADITGPVSEGPAAPAASARRERPRTLSRSYDRAAADPRKRAELRAAGGRTGRLVVRHVHIKPKPKPRPVHHRTVARRPVAHHPVAPAVVPSGDPRSIAGGLLSSFGWSSDQLGCLVSLWDRESGWNTYAENPSSGAYGIPQALPGSKMASAGPDWRTNAATQIRWGLGYIRGRYGSPCGAWAHSQADGWY